MSKSKAGSTHHGQNAPAMMIRVLDVSSDVLSVWPRLSVEFAKDLRLAVDVTKIGAASSSSFRWSSLERPIFIASAGAPLVRDVSPAVVGSRCVSVPLFPMKLSRGQDLVRACVQLGAVAALEASLNMDDVRELVLLVASLPGIPVSAGDPDSRCDLFLSGVLIGGLDNG